MGMDPSAGNSPGAPAPDPLLELSRSFTQIAGVSQRVAQALREMIFSGKIKPGERIVESRVARSLGIGQPTAREALKELEIEGLVVRHANKGCSVTVLTRDESAKIFRVRTELEVLAVELAIEEWTQAKSAALREIMERFHAAAEADDVASYSGCDREFHQFLWRCAENPYLERALVQIATPLFAFEMVRALQLNVHDLANGFKCHQRVAEAVLSGDREYAKHVMRQEMRRGGAFVERFVTPEPPVQNRPESA